MNKCSVYVSNMESKYEGQYDLREGYLEVMIFDYYGDIDEYTPIGSEVSYKNIYIADLLNRKFMFSSRFHRVCGKNGLTQYQKYKTDFYLATKKENDFDAFFHDININGVILYNSVLNNLYNNPSIVISENEKEIVYRQILNPDKKIIEINKNNIDCIEFLGTCNSISKNDNRNITIESENKAKIKLNQPIKCEEVLKYINEFDVIMNSYCLLGIHSYTTYIITTDNKCFDVKHKLLCKDKYCEKVLYQPVKVDFFVYVEKMYKTLDYRTTANRNKYVPFGFISPTTLEEQFVFYFRCIDLYMGEYLEKETGKYPSNYDRLSTFVDENIDLFRYDEEVNIENLKKELNSLRNQYIHEGYYLCNNKFSVTEKKRKLYDKELDYIWLLKMVKIFKYGVYKMLYTKILTCEIDEAQLKNVLKCWV